MFPNMQTDNPSAAVHTVMAAVVPGEQQQVARQRTITQGSGYSGPGSSRGQEVGTRGHPGCTIFVSWSENVTIYQAK